MFFCRYFFSKLSFSKISFRNISWYQTVWSGIRLHCFAWPDLGPKCLQRLSADDIGRRRIALYSILSIQLETVPFECYLKIVFILANSDVLDEMPHLVASHLGLHLLFIARRD